MSRQKIKLGGADLINPRAQALDLRSRDREKGSSMAAGWLCTAVGGTAERLPLSPKVPTRYTTGASSVATARRTVGDAFDAGLDGLRWRAGGATSRVVRDGCRR
jgi:hypothetical protein